MDAVRQGPLQRRPCQPRTCSEGKRDGRPSPDDRPRLVLDGRTIASGEDYFPFRAQWISEDEFLYAADGLIKRRSLGGGEKRPVTFAATLTVRRPTYTRKSRDLSSSAATRVLGVMHPVASPDGARVAFGALGILWTMDVGARRRE